MARRLRDPAIPDHDGTVMQGGAFVENTRQELGAYQTVKGNSMHEVFVEGLFALENDNCPGFFCGKRKNCAGQLHEIEPETVCLAAEQVPQGAEAVERLANLGLENNYYKNEQDGA